MKTIFYIISTDDTGDYWFNNKPYKEWFTLENTLYEPNGNIIKTTKDENNFVKNVSISITEDRFNHGGITRRIVLYIN